MNRRARLAWIPVLFELSAMCAWAVAAASFPRVAEGEINGARTTIAYPPGTWNGRLLLHAHGYRAETAPLVADLPTTHLAYATLLSEGWMVAATSYRRNGIVLADAIADLDALRAHIVQTYGEPSMVILEGESMGGTIVALIAERGTDAYAGGIAIGASLDVREANGSGGVTLQPKIPLIFLTNQSELEGPKTYVQRVSQSTATVNGLVAPALFRVSRNGHVNVNQPERLIALRALIAWIENGRETLPKPAAPPAGEHGIVFGARDFFDATVVPAPQPSRVVFGPDETSFAATVTEISAIYGNAFIDVQPADLAKAGISPGSYFQLVSGERTFRVRYGRDFSSVDRGQWVVFPNADGFFWLARNSGNAAESAGLAIGSAVRILRYPAP